MNLKVVCLRSRNQVLYFKVSASEANASTALSFRRAEADDGYTALATIAGQ